MACSEPTPDETDPDPVYEYIGPTGNENDRSGELTASFISSQENVIRNQNQIGDNEFVPITFISTAQNYDSLVWVFERGIPLDFDGNRIPPDNLSAAAVSATLDTINNIPHLTLRGRADDPVSPISVKVGFYPFGRFTVRHGVSNRTNFDVNTKRDFVKFEYGENWGNQVTTATSSSSWKLEDTATGNASLWVPPSNHMYSSCPDSMLAFFTLEGDSYISKSFSGFTRSEKSLVFEYKFEYRSATTDETSKKLSVSIFPSTTLSINASDLPPIWEETSNTVTEFEEAIIPIPQVEEFTLIFTKYDVPNDASFSVCIRNMKIISNE
ncbi:MAG: hypothetical protein ACON42_07035 [Flavobacteriaceae bacterium]